MNTFMNEKRLISRWVILGSAFVGGLFGAILMYLFALLAVI